MSANYEITKNDDYGSFRNDFKMFSKVILATKKGEKKFEPRYNRMYDCNVYTKISFFLR